MARRRYRLKLMGDNEVDPAFSVLYESLREYGVEFTIVPANCCPALSADDFNQYGAESILVFLANAGEINEGQREETMDRIKQAWERAFDAVGC
ncbi:MAG: hypothetical protein KJ718_02885 [Nanoarchaeota archaeon]|nr:hypothetical protein [Nanoarchaeota archaeon]MBU1051474.1 hypothetical protein [Nanoarchaeota archaeon]MBU1988414.1 hypothetical protein [Nanoarchaeota archaeon]